MPRDNFNKIDEEYFSTILDESFSFNGTVKFDSSCIIKGHIKGKIESKGKIVIGPNAIIDADVAANALECFGKINGNVSVNDEAYFHAPSILNGSLKTTLFTFEKGCMLNGKVSMNSNANSSIDHEDKITKLNKGKK